MTPTPKRTDLSPRLGRVHPPADPPRRAASHAQSETRVLSRLVSISRVDHHHTLHFIAQVSPQSLLLLTKSRPVILILCVDEDRTPTRPAVSYRVVSCLIVSEVGEGRARPTDAFRLCTLCNAETSFDLVVVEIDRTSLQSRDDDDDVEDHDDDVSVCDFLGACLPSLSAPPSLL